VLTLDPQPVRLFHRSYEPEDGLEHTVNDSDEWMLVLPYTTGAIRLERAGTIVHDGPVRPGMVRVVAPHERSAMAADSRFEAARISLPPATLTAVAETLGSLDEVAAVIGARQELRRLCPPLVSAFQLRGRRRDLVVEGLATALVALILDHASAPSAHPGLDDVQFAAAVAFAETRLSIGLELDNWAAAVGLATTEFSRRFRRLTGVAPYAWFMDRRIDESMRLLASSDLPIVDIALQMGFSSQSHFTDAFTRRAGIPPGRWRAATGRGDSRNS
jgi:AraC family transcriptional regulator